VTMINMNTENNNNFRSGAVLLVVLFIIMVITVLSLGFISRSDVELACGQNMILRTQMDYLAESGLEHAKGLILNPQDIDTEYFTGATNQQLVAGSNDYYSIDIVRDESDPNDQCNYTIDCNSYRSRNGEEIGRSSITATLRLDPCIALWTGTNTIINNQTEIFGDVFCNGALNNKGIIEGDAFSNYLWGNDITGRRYAVNELSLNWPGVTVDGFKDRAGVTYQSGNYTLTDDISGMLLVDGDLTIQSGSELSIIAGKNQPALYVTGDLIIEKYADLNIEGLAAVDGQIIIDGDANMNVAGGLFTGETISEAASDLSGSNDYAILYNGPEWATGKYDGGLRFDGINDKVENFTLPDSINGLSAITLSLWVKSDVTYQDRDILFTREPTDDDNELGIRYDRNGAYGSGSSGIKASIKTTSGYTQIESSSNVQTTGWQHLVLTWENDPNDSRLKLYINGALDTPRYDKGPVTGTITGIQKLMLGCGTKNTYWDGLIDDVRIYGRQLSSSEIQDLYNNNVVSDSDLILHWQFNEAGTNISITAAPSKAAVLIWSEDGDVEKWGQAAGAFFRSIERR